MDLDFMQVFAWIKGPVYAAMSTGAFSVLFGLHTAEILLASGGSAIGWIVLQAVPPLPGMPASPTVLPVFFASLAAGLYGELVGHFRGRPATVYMIASIIPFVPGGGMYYTMLSTLQSDSTRTIQLAMDTLMAAFAIAVGLAIANVIARLVFSSVQRGVKKRR